MFYWAPGSIASAARIYCESARDPGARLRRGRVEVPVAYAAFPHEIVRAAAAVGRARTTRSRAGPRCRAAGTSRRSRQPELLLDDVRAFFG